MQRIGLEQLTSMETVTSEPRTVTLVRARMLRPSRLRCNAPKLVLLGFVRAAETTCLISRNQWKPPPPSSRTVISEARRPSLNSRTPLPSRQPECQRLVTFEWSCEAVPP